LCNLFLKLCTVEYEVAIVKGIIREKLMYDKNGVFIKKLPPPPPPPPAPKK
jgi:hypothetical protein